SEITSLTPRSPRRASLRRKAVPERLGLGRTDVETENLAPAVCVDADRNDHGDRYNAPVLPHLHVGGADPQIRPVPFHRAIEEGLHLLVDLFAQPADLALGDAAHPHRLDQVVDRAGRDALHIGFLHHRGQGLFGHPARLQEGRKIAALAQLGDAQLDRAGTRLPVAVAIAVALGATLSALLTITGAGEAFDFQLHQALRRKADHLAQEIGVGGLLDQGTKVHLLVGHRWLLESGWRSQPDPTGESSMTTAKPLARYGAMGARFASGF